MFSFYIGMVIPEYTKKTTLSNIGITDRHCNALLVVGPGPHYMIPEFGRMWFDYFGSVANMNTQNSQTDGRTSWQ